VPHATCHIPHITCPAPQGIVFVYVLCLVYKESGDMMSEQTFNIIDDVFLSLFTLEMIVKILVDYLYSR
jgi:hypothetical protein